MMQHIATLKPELASKTALPFEGFHNVADPSVSNRNTSGQDSAKRSAFEDAIKRAKDNNSANNDNQNTVVRDKQYEQAQRRAEERSRADEQAQRTQARTEANNQQQSDKQARLQAEQQNRQDDLVLRQQKEQQSADEQSIRDKHNAETEQTKLAQQKQSDSIESSNPVDAKKVKSNASAEQGDDLSEQNIKNDLYLGTLGEGSAEGEFDWVEYVNQVRLLDNNEQLSQDLKDADLSVPNDLFSQFIADQELSKAKGSTELTADIDSSVKNDEFRSVTLNQQDLALLLEGQGIAVDSDAAIDQEKLVALDEAVANILQQVLDSTDGPNAGIPQDVVDENVGNQDKLDTELLKAMLSNKEAKQGHIQDGKAKDDGNITNDLHLANAANVDADLYATANDQVLSSSIPADLAKQATLENSQASPNKQVTQTSDSLTQQTLLAAQTKLESENEQSVATEGASTPTDLPSEFALNKVTQAINVEVPKKTTSKQGVDILAKLPDEKLDAALENINKRVSEIVPELKTEAKGSEFVAALQAGVKEVKEQLKQGREPGIDLKAIVADAMVKADVPVVQGQAEVKLDKQIAQVSTILGAGTAITQTNTQVLNSSLGLGDLNIQKEMSQAQVENAKQLQQQTGANDKAINILKPDGQTQLAEKVRWMVNNRSLTAEIRLDPPDLGGMQIKVAMSGDAASVNFTVQSQLARDVLDSAAPQLREMLEEQGIELGESNVKQDGQGSQQEELADKGNFGTSSAKGTNSSDNESQNNDLDAQNSIGEQAVVNGRLGGIDYYA